MATQAPPSTGPAQNQTAEEKLQPVSLALDRRPRPLGCSWSTVTPIRTKQRAWNPGAEGRRSGTCF
jgi:hypothetical protein